MHRLALPLAVWLLCVAAGSARDLFVNNETGDDLADGLAERSGRQESGPVRSITRALGVAAAGDRIVLAGTETPYRESISLCTGRHSGLSGKPFTIAGNGAILDGTSSVPPRIWQHAWRDLFRFRPARLTYQQLYLGDRPAVRRPADPDAADWPELNPLEWMLADGQIYFRPEEGKLPDEYELRYAAHVTGITLDHVRNVRIANLVVQGFQLDGVNAHDGISGCLLQNLTCRGNGRSGISVGGSSRVRIDACLVGDNGVAQIRCEGHSITQVTESEVVANTAPAYEVRGGQLYVDGKPVEPEEQNGLR